MALAHEFAVVDEEFTMAEVRGYTNIVKIPDAMMQYFADTFKWVITYWNDKQEKVGLNYYGYTIIKGANIENLNKSEVLEWLEDLLRVCIRAIEERKFLLHMGI